MATNKLNLPTITHNQTADVPRDLNALANAVDAKVAVPNGLATLGADGKVPAAQIAVDLTSIERAIADDKQALATHAGTSAGIAAKGHVQLSSSTTSNDETMAATPRAVKSAYDRAEAAFTSASNGKTAIKQAVAGVDPRVVVPADPSFAQLATAVGQIQTGKKHAFGTVSVTPFGNYTDLDGVRVTTGQAIVSGLTFRPTLIKLFFTQYPSPQLPQSYSSSMTIYTVESGHTPTGVIMMGEWLKRSSTNVQPPQYVIDPTIGPAFVSASGFNLPVYRVPDGATISWEAYE